MVAFSGVGGQATKSMQKKFYYAVYNNYVGHDLIFALRQCVYALSAGVFRIHVCHHLQHCSPLAVVEKKFMSITIGQ